LYPNTRSVKRFGDRELIDWYRVNYGYLNILSRNSDLGKR